MLSNLLSISKYMTVLPRDILVPSPINGPCLGFTSTCASIPAMIPEMRYFCLTSCKLASPPEVRGKYIDRNRILSREKESQWMRLTEESLSFKEFSSVSFLPSIFVRLPSAFALLLLTFCHSGSFCAESPSTKIIASASRWKPPMSNWVSAFFVLFHLLWMLETCNSFFTSSAVSNSRWISLCEVSTSTRPCAQWGPANPTSTISFWSPSAEADIPGTSTWRIFKSVDVLNVAWMFPSLFTLAVEHGGPHSTLVNSVTFIFCSHLSSFPFSVTKRFLFWDLPPPERSGFQVIPSTSCSYGACP